MQLHLKDGSLCLCVQNFVHLLTVNSFAVFHNIYCVLFDKIKNKCLFLSSFLIIFDNFFFSLKEENISCFINFNFNLCIYQKFIRYFRFL